MQDDDQVRVHVRVRRVAEQPDEDFVQYRFSAPRNGFMGFVKGFSFGFALLGGLDMLTLIKFTDENKFFHQGISFAFALLGTAWGLREESRQPIRIAINEHNASLRERIGIFWERAQAARPPRTGPEGLAKGFMFSMLLLIFSEPYMSFTNALKLVLAATVLSGMLGFYNENQGFQRR